MSHHQPHQCATTGCTHCANCGDGPIYSSTWWGNDGPYCYFCASMKSYGEAARSEETKA